MTKYKIVPLGANMFQVLETHWYGDKQLQFYGVAPNWGDTVQWLTDYGFPSIEEAIEALAWRIRLSGIQDAHRRSRERAVKAHAAKNKPICIPPWPKKDAVK